MPAPLLQATATAYFEGGTDGNLHINVQVTSSDPAIQQRLAQFNQSSDAFSPLFDGISFQSYLSVQEVPPSGATSGALDASGSKENKVIGS